MSPTPHENLNLTLTDADKKFLHDVRERLQGKDVPARMRLDDGLSTAQWVVQLALEHAQKCDAKLKTLGL